MTVIVIFLVLMPLLGMLLPGRSRGVRARHGGPVGHRLASCRGRHLRGGSRTVARGDLPRRKSSS
ncbi:hypothetical protein [Streptomyces sp. NBC_01262]|uniref:hypothetical protein n=1 Tax=Streptomyces sp. NBC_01262 TaxID=2903803 RepID=UPI002E36E98B|nr:hypothetical protein [Streptomyces sp. NBC_01262]